MGLMHPDVLPHLSGRVVTMAVPAEEYIEIEYRDRLRRDGKIEFWAGNPSSSGWANLTTYTWQ